MKAVHKLIKETKSVISISKALPSEKSPYNMWTHPCTNNHSNHLNTYRIIDG